MDSHYKPPQAMPVTKCHGTTIEHTHIENMHDLTLLFPISHLLVLMSHTYLIFNLTALVSLIGALALKMDLFTLPMLAQLTFQ